MDANYSQSETSMVYEVLINKFLPFRKYTLSSGNFNAGNTKSQPVGMLSPEVLRTTITINSHVMIKAIDSNGSNTYILLLGERATMSTLLNKNIAATKGSPLLVVYSETLTTQTQENICKTNPNVIFREYFMFLHSWLDHQNTAKCRIMPKEEQDVVFKLMYINKNYLPKIISSNMLCTWLGAVKGDIIVVEEFGESSSYSYRQVV